MQKRLLWVALFFIFVLLPTNAFGDAQWGKSPSNPVLGPTPNQWDANYTTTPRVIYDGKIYRMWFNGGASGSSGVGFATSNDGISWSQLAGAVLEPGAPGAWDSSSVALGSVLWNGTSFMMWYRGSNPTAFVSGAVGLATSKDGVSWTKNSLNPVLTATAIDQGYIASPYVIRLGLTYNMWYTGKNAKSTQFTSILYATSFDGLKWSKWPHPVFFSSSDPTAWDSGSVYSPSVYFNGTTFWLWYSGLGPDNGPPQIGLATSPDGATWTRYPSNPILSPGAQGTWDFAGVEQASLATGDGLMIYYDGIGAGSGPRIGLAQAPQGFTIPEFPVPSVLILLAVAVCAASLLRKRKQAKTLSD
jgi:predicted GH43/DUF377 family glycosyl hydrolase